MIKFKKFNDFNFFRDKKKFFKKYVSVYINRIYEGKRRI